MSRKIFISYNHKDQPCALKIRDKLLGNGDEVLIDIDRMRPGENIEQFIMNCFRASDTTLSLISANSLMSAWVAMETINSNVDEKISNRRFIPCFIDKEFFDRSFTGKALSAIENNLKEIDGFMTTAIEKGWGIDDLQGERSRYRKLRDNLPDIIGKLRNSLCIDLTGEHFETGMQKILSDLGQSSMAGKPEENEPATEAMNILREKIQGILNQGQKQRLLLLQARLIELQQLLSKCEEELDFETEPIRQMRHKRDIKRLKESIQQVVDEVQSSNPQP